MGQYYSTNKRKNVGVASLWEEMKLRGRILTLMLVVSILAVLICAGSFVIMNHRMLENSHQDVNDLSDTVHYVVEQAFYQQETYMQQIYVFSQKDYIDQALAEQSINGDAPDWNTLVKEAYDMVNSWNYYNNSGILDASETIQFIMIDDEIFVYGASKEFFIDCVDRFYTVLNESGQYSNNGFIDDINANYCGNLYSTGEDSKIMVWEEVANGAGRVGMIVTQLNAYDSADALRFLMDNEAGIAMDNMAKTAWQLLMSFALVVAALLVVLPLASRRLTLLVINPVEQERERQSSLLSAAEGEKALLERLDRLKIEFFKNMSHDLKTPLTVISTDIINAADQLFYEMDKEDMRLSLENAQREIMRMARMIENTMRHSSMQGNTYDMKPIEIASILRDGAATYRAILERQGNDLYLMIPETLPPICGNADMLLYVLSNLLSNANRHTHNGEITIRAVEECAMIKVTVQDTGEGVKPELLPHVFERGVSDGGSGLGLHICKSAIDSHNGTITLQSERGRGTIVSFALPVLQHEAEVPQIGL